MDLASTEWSCGLGLLSEILMGCGLMKTFWAPSAEKKKKKRQKKTSL